MNKNDEAEFIKAQSRRLKMSALIQLQAGCLTFVVAIIFAAIGLWLDWRLGTIPRWTLILLIGSAPFVLGAVFLIVRRTIRKMQSPPKPSVPDDVKDFETKGN